MLKHIAIQAVWQGIILLVITFTAHMFVSEDRLSFSPDVLKRIADVDSFSYCNKATVDAGTCGFANSLGMGYKKIYEKYTDGSASSPFHDDKSKYESDVGGTKTIYAFTFAAEWLEVTTGKNDAPSGETSQTDRLKAGLAVCATDGAASVPANGATAAEKAKGEKCYKVLIMDIAQSLKAGGSDSQTEIKTGGKFAALVTSPLSKYAPPRSSNRLARSIGRVTSEPVRRTPTSVPRSTTRRSRR
jgi:hypothetical protein